MLKKKNSAKIQSSWPNAWIITHIYWPQYLTRKSKTKQRNQCKTEDRTTPQIVAFSFMKYGICGRLIGKALADILFSGSFWRYHTDIYSRDFSYLIPSVKIGVFSPFHYLADLDLRGFYISFFVIFFSYYEITSWPVACGFFLRHSIRLKWCSMFFNLGKQIV